MERVTVQQQGAVATLEEHQQALYMLLKEFDRVARMLHTPYFLFAGTLLGAVRHKGFIPWDDDLDVVMLRKDYERFLKEAPQVLNQDLFFLQGEFSEHWPMFFSKLRLNGTTCLEKYHPKDEETHQGVYIDMNDIKVLFIGEGLTNVKLHGRASHNTILQMIYQFGMVGVPLLIGWIGCYWRSTHTKKHVVPNIVQKIVLLSGSFLPWMAIDALFFDEFFLLQWFCILGFQEIDKSAAVKRIEENG